ncbi:hypothetical protein L0657_06390 [Dyadobacter sp. CY345]|uniref:hypothetical protein n=1 Tax=Dyadobacter sp. CY345 TaxID=2909335 RepID=UPI001F3FA4A9|nr:hypothetical protein [Dyadobacter sp. CY345]MCF2443581.1 hypothetical protein [Dyadobacter sp. CY345]
MLQLLKYSDVLGPYFFMILVVFTFACAVWLISGLRKSSSNNEWFVKRSANDYKRIVIH